MNSVYQVHIILPILNFMIDFLLNMIKHCAKKFYRQWNLPSLQENCLNSLGLMIPTDALNVREGMINARLFIDQFRRSNCKC